MNQQTRNVNDHQNIRNFMEFGWDGISFEGEALKAEVRSQKIPGMAGLESTSLPTTTNIY
ncbi:HopJ type III effector protein [Chryseobacterium sp.]|uniref:HopJ type III effector protein n=1 Tax=Chryseobacterium sp. TaxID=1871047 RepID=UPI001E479E0E|nr:HopJ type III effector protein [Chryseobacterium sp.]